MLKTRVLKRLIKEKTGADFPVLWKLNRVVGLANWE